MNLSLTLHTISFFTDSLSCSHKGLQDFSLVLFTTQDSVSRLQVHFGTSISLCEDCDCFFNYYD